MGEYTAHIDEEVKPRPLYLVRDMLATEEPSGPLPSAPVARPSVRAKP